MSENLQIKNKNLNKELKSSISNNNVYTNQKVNTNSTINEVIDLNVSNNSNQFLISRSISTGAMIYIKASSGILDVFEHIGDGLVWTGGKVIEGESYVVAEVAGLFNEETKKYILNWREDAKKWVKDDIEVKAIDSLEEELFNTKFGKGINNSSYIKHDSEVAKNIEKGTKITTEVVLATAATIATGGVASPTMVAVVGGLGFAEGTGEKAQDTYQNDLKTTGAKEVNIAFNGIAKGASWVAMGLLGTATIKQISNIGNIFSKSGSFGNFLKATKETITTNKMRTTKAYLFRTKNKYRELQNVVDTVGSLFDTLSDSIDNNDSIGRTSAKVGVGLVTNILLNRIFDIGSLWARDRRAATNIAEIYGRGNYGLKCSIHSAIKLLIEQLDTSLDSGFFDTDLTSISIDKMFDKIQRSE